MRTKRELVVTTECGVQNCAVEARFTIVRGCWAFTACRGSAQRSSRRWPVSEWEYRKIDLNQRPRKVDEIDLLNDAGNDGWELVAILANNVAYLKRQLGDSGSEMSERILGADPGEAVVRPDNGHDASVRKGYVAKVKYRDPKTNETWSGRGRMASWLKRKQEAGEDIEEYHV